MYDKVFSHLWMHVPREERAVLVERFGLSKTGIAEIKDQTVVSDGYTNEDLSVITADRMLEYVGGDYEEGQVPSFARLWELSIAKAHYELNPPIMYPQLSVVPIVEPEAPQPATEPVKVDDTATTVFIGENGEGLKKGPGLFKEPKRKNNGTKTKES